MTIQTHFGVLNLLKDVHSTQCTDLLYSRWSVPLTCSLHVAQRVSNSRLELLQPRQQVYNVEYPKWITALWSTFRSSPISWHFLSLRFQINDFLLWNWFWLLAVAQCIASVAACVGGENDWPHSTYRHTVWVTSQRPEQTNKETSKFRSALQCRALPVPCSNLRTFLIHAKHIHDLWAPQHRSIHERTSLRRLFKRRRGVAREYYMRASYDVTWLGSCIFAVDDLLGAPNVCYIKLINWRRL